MASLQGTSQSSTFDSLLKIDDNEPITGSLKWVTDGFGNKTTIKVSSDMTEIFDVTFSGPITFASGYSFSSLIPESQGGTGKASIEQTIADYYVYADGVLDDQNDPNPDDWVLVADSAHSFQVKKLSLAQLTADFGGGGGVTDHGALTGLSDDDHTQYHTDARALTWIGTRSTTDLSEGTNLYYTSSRFNTAFSAKSTTDLAEGTNLYYTTARWDTQLATKTTTNLSEGTNLYYTDERVDDRVSTLIQNGTGITWSYNDGLGTLTPTVTITQYTDEMAQDTVSTMIQNGTGITWSYNDGANTLTPTVTITQYTDELAQDAVGTILANSTFINAVYSDATPSITMSLSATGTPDSTTFLRGDNTWATPSGGGNSFETISIAGQSDVVADSSTDTLTLVAGSNITLTTNAGTDTITIAATGGGTLGDGDYGDITVSGTGTVMTIDNDVVTYAKMQNVSATDRLLGRVTAGAGDVEEIPISDFVQTILDDADATAVRATIGAVIGTNVQAYDAELAALAGLTSAADALPYFTGSGTAAVTTLSSYARTFLDDANEATLKATLNLEANTDYYAPAGTDVALADGGTGASLTDPNADRVMFWDDSAGAVTWLTMGTNLTITGTTLDASGGGGGNSFETISVSGQSDVVADSSTDTLTLVAGTDITITTNAGTDTITINSTAASGSTNLGLTTLIANSQFSN